MQHVACAVAPIPAHGFLSRRFSRVRSATTSFKAVASRRRSFTSPDVAARAVSPANRRCRPQGIPSSNRNTSRWRCLRGGKAPRLAGQGIPDRQESNSTFRRGLLPFPRWDPVGVCVGCCPERRCRMASRDSICAWRFSRNDRPRTSRISCCVRTSFRLRMTRPGGPSGSRRARPAGPGSRPHRRNTSCRIRPAA